MERGDDDSSADDERGDEVGSADDESGEVDSGVAAPTPYSELVVRYMPRLSRLLAALADGTDEPYE